MPLPGIGRLSDRSPIRFQRPPSRLRPDAMKTLRALALSVAFACAVGSAQAALRPEIGKPLQQAAEYLKAGKAKEAMAKVREAEAVPNRNRDEQLTIDRMKAAAAQRAGDFPAAIQALEAIHGKVPAAEQGPLAEQLASAYAQTRNNAKAQEWLGKAQAAGHSSPTMKQLQSYLQSASGDFAAVAKDAGAAVAAAEQAGRRPDEADLLRLADAQQRTGNAAGYLATLEKLVSLYPKKDYWAAYLGRLPRKAGFSDRLSLDVLRLRLAAGVLSRPEEFMEMAQLALQAGLPAEAVKIVDKGFAQKVLGQGAEADRHRRLRELAVRKEGEAKAGIAAQVAEAGDDKTGEAQVKVGYQLVTMGEVDKGVALIEAGLAKGALKHPEQARLRLGMAQLQSPATRAKGVQTLRGLKASDGTAEVARLWTVLGPGA